MGYKKILRYGLSTVKKVADEAEREEKRKAREEERIQRKIKKINERMITITQALEDLYAKGKIGEDKFKELLQRKDDISLDLLVIGKTPGVSLAKRYITGKIDKHEFEKIKKDILPFDLFEEKKIIQEEFDNTKKELRSFRENCKKDVENECQSCGKKKSFLDSLKIEDGLKLCRKCRSQLLNLQNYKGFQGKYFEVHPLRIIFDDIDKGLEVNLRKDLL